ncbi:MAG TPA: hypothetical protein VHA33_04240 [Candidatus Angelobacter sp.]|nr:hypothetical protein [Candidatus Angelobacter sp.]
MVLVSDPDKRTNQHEASKGNLQPHLRRGSLRADGRINGLMEALAHQRRELRIPGFAFKLVEPGVAVPACVHMDEGFGAEFITAAGLQPIGNFK